MKILLPALILIALSLTGCQVNRYYFAVDKPMPLYEFASFSGPPVDTAHVGESVCSTGKKLSSIGGDVPVEYNGYQFYSPVTTAHFVKRTKIDPCKEEVLSGIVYAPRKQWAKQAANREQEQIKEAENDKIECYGQVNYARELLASNYATATVIHKLPVNSILRIWPYDGSYWIAELDGKRGYIPMHHIAYFSKGNQPFVRTDYTGRRYQPDVVDNSTRTDTPTTGATIHTGPRGGRYYYNSNGNKTYVPRSSGGRGRR